jgi:IS5 family transposase
MMLLTTAWSSELEGHPSGEQDTTGTAAPWAGLRRALGALPGGVEQVALRADAGYFAADLAAAAHFAGTSSSRMAAC